jgi:hypothetical protein
MNIEGLGRVLDVGLAFAPVDSQTAAITGKRLSLQNGSAATIVVVKAAGTADDDPVLTLKQHTAASGGTTADLASITRYFTKQEATLDNDESWVVNTQAAAATVTGNATSAESQMIIAIPVGADQLSDGYTHVSLNVADTGAAGAQLIAGVYILHDLSNQRSPELLGSLLSPGTANA